MSSSNLENAIIAYAELTDQIKALEAEKKQLAEILKKELPEGATVAGDWTLAKTVNPSRKTFDKEAASAAGVPIDDYVKVGKPFITLTAKRLG